MTGTISLGGKTFPVEPFTFAQLRVIMPAFARSGGRLLTTEAFDAVADILAAAVPELTREAVEALPVQAPELFAALDVIAEVSGLVQPGEARAGTASL